MTTTTTETVAALRDDMTRAAASKHRELDPISWFAMQLIRRVSLRGHHDPEVADAFRHDICEALKDLTEEGN